MTLEIIIFTLAVLFGILLYWRESKNNSMYRFVNKLTHTQEQQMKKSDRKGFLFKQPFLMRLVYIALFYLIGFIIVNFLTPINIFYPKYFATTIVGTVLGTYFASLIVLANEKIDDSHDVLEDTIEKSKDFIKEITDDVKETAKSVKDRIDESFEKDDAIIETTRDNDQQELKKSGRDRLKEKGLL